MAPAEPAGRSSWRGTRSCGFLECAAAPRQPPGPVDRWCCTIVNASTADPRLDGCPVRRIAFETEHIAQRVRELGAEITAHYPEGELLVLGLLKGSFIFLGDLV